MYIVLLAVRNEQMIQAEEGAARDNGTERKNNTSLNSKFTISNPIHQCPPFLSPQRHYAYLLVSSNDH